MFKFLVPLFLSSVQVAQANYAVFDIFSSESECEARANVQASFRREMGVCINLPPDFPTSFFYSPKQSYRFDSCANTFPQMSLSLSVFDEVDCAGDGITVEMSDMLPAACESNVLMSCEDTPMAMAEDWPSIDMWAPTSFDTDPNCDPDARPHEVLSLAPHGALYREYIGGTLNGLKAVCKDNAGDADEMIVKLYRDVDTSPNSENLPFWTSQNAVDKCFVVGDLLETCPSCLSHFPPGQGTMMHMAAKAGLTTSERVYLAELAVRTSVKFRCY